jgi:hypothetical protein
MPVHRQYTVLREVTSTHESRPDRHYQIRLGSDGVTYCTCPGWRFRRTCRHLDEYNQVRSGERYDTANMHVDLEAERISEERQSEARAEAIADSLREGDFMAVPRTRPIRAKTNLVRKWEVYDQDKLLGTMYATSKDDVVRRIHAYNGDQDTLRIEEQGAI